MDPAKAVSNLENHGVAFDAVVRFALDAALVVTDVRHSAEHRLIAYGPIGERLHTCIFTMRGERVRIISLWKSNNREIRRYMEAGNAEDQHE